MSSFWRDYKLNFYILRRPFQGFYAMKYEGRGKMSVALLNFLALWISFSFTRQYSSIIVDQTYPLNLNSFLDGASIMGILLLWSAANWSITSLTDGEGKFKEIFMANCYAFMPLILFLIPAALFSNILAEGEGAFYFMLMQIALMWFLALGFIGMVTVHGFTVGKAIFTLFLTFIALLIIVFLISLVMMLWQQVVVFFFSVYTEIIFRL